MYSCIWNFNNDFLMNEVSAKYLREINSKLIKNVAWNVSLHNLKRNANKINKNVKKKKQIFTKWKAIKLHTLYYSKTPA